MLTRIADWKNSCCKVVGRSSHIWWLTIGSPKLEGDFMLELSLFPDFSDPFRFVREKTCFTLSCF